jgi:hypothetical protein
VALASLARASLAFASLAFASLAFASAGGAVSRRQAGVEEETRTQTQGVGGA